MVYKHRTTLYVIFVEFDEITYRFNCWLVLIKAFCYITKRQWYKG